MRQPPSQLVREPQFHIRRVIFQRLRGRALKHAAERIFHRPIHCHNRFGSDHHAAVSDVCRSGDPDLNAISRLSLHPEAT